MKITQIIRGRRYTYLTTEDGREHSIRESEMLGMLRRHNCSRAERLIGRQFRSREWTARAIEFSFRKAG